GKRRVEAVGEVSWTVLSARWYADHPPLPERVGAALVRRVPLGVIAVVTPWNVPLLGAAWKWLPALMAGNTLVWKASELTPAVSLATSRLLAEAGLPFGVCELVLGDGRAGQSLVADDRIGAVHFTGSTRTGRAIAVAVASRLIPVALELGGLNPVLVFDDADLDLAASAVVEAATAINGQKCTATRRVLVAERVAAPFTDALADRMRALVVADPAEETTELGPLVTPAASRAAEEAVAGASRRGARLVVRSSDGPGAAYSPATLVADLPPADPLASHELFAPVVSLETFTADDQAWERANATVYGLAASVHTRDPDRIRTAPERLRAGVVNVNRRGDAVDLEPPFGGWGASGNGHPEGGSYVYSALTAWQACYGVTGDPA
ncbi:MAG TPA: aldehyde dehydrogenase family protein, partial [Actinomycetota bacterium]|nr:aldehyde dehydrogenase family protein [Actinomycetota bacterium]